MTYSQFAGQLWPHTQVISRNRTYMYTYSEAGKGQDVSASHLQVGLHCCGAPVAQKIGRVLSRPHYAAHLRACIRG